MKKNGFTLIELMIVITLIVLLAGFTGADYLKFRDRLQLEGTARNIASTFELANKYARTGNRGDGRNCALSENGGQVTQADILNQTFPLLYWGVRTAGAGETLETYVCCGDNYSNCRNYPDDKTDTIKTINLPKNIRVKNSFDYKFKSLWGGVMDETHADIDSAKSIQIQAFEDNLDEKSNYYFRLGEEGWTTDGCFGDKWQLLTQVCE
jgi:prepilin-type N-terminal cleavage/methylation domain-containing protein